MSDKDLKNRANAAVQALLLSPELKIAEALSRDDLFERYFSEISQAKEKFLNGEAAQRPQGGVVFDAALNDALLADQGHLSCPIW